MPRYRQTTVGVVEHQATQRQKPKDANRSCDPACREMLQGRPEGLATTAFDRYLAQQPQCNFGLEGICCRICIQGPCRILPKREGGDRGICGARDYAIVARNTCRYIAGGAASHAEHGRHICETVQKLLDGKAPSYSLRDTAKLRAVATRLGVAVEGREDNDIAQEVVDRALVDFTRTGHEPCDFLMTTITEGRRRKFQHCGVAPSAIDRTIVENIAQTAMGMDNDPVNLIFCGLKTSLADYTGMHIATDLSDVLFGTPRPVRSRANLGVIDPEKVNIAAHGHNPTLSEMVVAAAEELEGEAKAAGAKGINVVGICCTGNELLMRQGVPLATNMSGQELAVMTGALDAVVMDIQCFIPGLKAMSECFHTRMITTHPLAKMPGTHYIQFDEKTGLEDAKEMVRLAIEAYKGRDPSRVRIPSFQSELVAGFSFEAIKEIFSAINPERPFKVLTDAILDGELAGVCLMAGCTNQRAPHDEGHLTVARELAKNNVLMVATGCSAVCLAKSGLMDPARNAEFAGDGLRAFLDRVAKAAGVETGLPVAWHQGSCVDNSRSADLWTAMAEEMGCDVPKVPFVASAPEAMHEKAMSIGSWCVTMGIPTHVGVMPPLEGSDLIYGLATQIAHDVYGGHFILEQDPEKGARKLLDALEYRAWKLRVHRAAAAKYETDEAAGW